MRKSIAAVCILIAGTFGQAMAQSPAKNVIRKAANALGGVNRVMSIKTLRIEGYGQDALEGGGGNTSPSINAPQRWNNILSYEKTIDLAHGRIRVRQRQQAWVPAATLSRVIGNILTTAILDGDVAYTVNQQGVARRASTAMADNLRIEMENHPVALVRLALDKSTAVSNLRVEGQYDVVDIRPAQGPPLTLAVDRATGLPVWVKWMQNNNELRDVTFQKWFTGYEPYNGVMMPSGFKTTIDFRNVVQKQIYVTRNVVDGPIADLAASAAVKAEPAPVRKLPAVIVTKVAPGVWLLSGSTHNSILIEFADHLTMYEVPLSEAWTQALIAKARTVVPGKPITQAIISHHHFDHTGGIRVAIADGMTIIAHRTSENMFREIAARKSTLVPDPLSRHPRPLKFMPVNDHLTLKDSTMEVDIYHVIGDEHMADALFAWVPRSRVLIEGDLFDPTWQNYPWGDVLANNAKLRHLNPALEVPVHGTIMSWDAVIKRIHEEEQPTKRLCKGPEAPLLPECEAMR